MNTNTGDVQRIAEERVHRRFERQTAALHKWQREETKRDADFQANAVVESVARQTMLQEQKKNALAEHDKLWKQAINRLTPRPEPAPAFDMMGGPPARNPVQDYDELHQRWSERRDQIVRDSDKDIATCRRERGAMLEGFARTNEARATSGTTKIASTWRSARRRRSRRSCKKKSIGRTNGTAPNSTGAAGMTTRVIFRGSFHNY